MASDFIPGGDALLDTWQGNFVAYVNSHLAGLGLVAGDVVKLNAAVATWTSDYPAHIAAHAAARSARELKEAARAGLEAAIRPLVRQLQASPKVDDGERAALGITVPDRRATPVGPPRTRPLVRVNIPARLRHTLALADEATPTRKAKPTGVLGAEIWVKIGDPPPAGPEELNFLTLVTRTVYAAEYASEHGGRTAHYMLRWISTVGEKGPWSETASATIGA